MGNLVANVIARPVAQSQEQLISLDRVRSWLAVLWLGLGTTILLIVVIQSLLDHFGADTQNAWGWLLPTIMPTMGIIVTVLGYTALDPKFADSVVRKNFFWIAFFLSAAYLVLILITILIQPLVPSRSPIELMHTSNLWLGPIQGLVASALGVLFVSKQEQNKGQPANVATPLEPLVQQPAIPQGNGG